MMKPRLGSLGAALIALATLIATVPVPAMGLDEPSTTGYRVVSIPALSLENPGDPIRIPELVNDNGWVVLGSAFDDIYQWWDSSGYPSTEIGCGDCASFVINDLNNANTLAGTYQTSSGLLRGYIRTESGGFEDVGAPPTFDPTGDLEVIGIDGQGRIAGMFLDETAACQPDRPDPLPGGSGGGPAFCAFMAEPAGGGSFAFTTLPQPPAGEANRVVDIEGGYVLGETWRWSTANGYELINDGGDFGVIAFGINESGEIAGWHQLDDATVVGAYWATPQSPPVDLVLDGHSVGGAHNINSDGWVVGYSDVDRIPTDQLRAFLYKPESDELIDLGTVGSSGSRAYDVSDASGVVVGSVSGQAAMWDLDGDLVLNQPAQVDETNLDATVTAGDLLEYQPPISDPEGDPFTVVWSGLPSTATWNSGTGTLSWQTTFDDAGAYVVEMTVEQNSIPVITVDVTLIVELATLTLEPIGDQTAEVGQPLSFTATSTGGVDPVFLMGSGTWPDLEPPPEGASIDAATGAFIWTPTPEQAGDHTLSIAVVDEMGGEDFETFTVTVIDDTAEPVVIVVDEPLAVADNVELLSPVIITLDETIGVADEILVAPAVLITINEVVGVGDEVHLVPSISITIAESVVVADDVAVRPPIVIGVLESIAVTGAVGVDPTGGATLNGMVWVDIDGNASNDDEPPFEGGVVFLDMDGDLVLDTNEPSAITGPDGSYSIDTVTMGQVSVRQARPVGYLQSFPAVAHDVNLTPGSTVHGLDFGIQPLPAGDLDDDGIANAVDARFDPATGEFDFEYLTPSSSFTDRLLPGGMTSGELVDPATLDIAIGDSDDDVAGVTISTGVGPAGEHAVVQLCDLPLPVRVWSGTRADFTCGSLSVTVSRGRVTLMTSDGARIDLASGSAITLVDDNTVAIEVVAGVATVAIGDLTVEIEQGDVVEGPASDTDLDGLTNLEEELTQTDPDRSDTDGDGLVDGLDASWLIAFLDELQDDHFKRRWHRTAMKLTIATAAVAVNLGDRDAALRITHFLDRRVDGCGDAPDWNDTIVSCNSQVIFRQMLDLYERGIANLPLPLPSWLE